jgi:hypothetical protein
MHTICPLPDKWSQIYSELQKIWEKSRASIPEPPRPLILNGWMFSNDMDKKRRWEETKVWIAKYANTELIENLTDADYYKVQELSSYIPYQFYDYDVKARPSDIEVNNAMAILKKDWLNIVGTGMGEHTEPYKFSGKKQRRLMVKVNSEFVPPWGSWKHIDSTKQEVFRAFRKAINSAIKPVYVDHVDFIV